MSSLLKRRLLNIGDATWFTFQILSHGHPCHLYDVVRRIQNTTYNVQSAVYVEEKGAPVLASYTAGSVGMRLCRRVCRRTCTYTTGFYPCNCILYLCTMQQLAIQRITVIYRWDVQINIQRYENTKLHIYAMCIHVQLNIYKAGICVMEHLMTDSYMGYCVI